MGRKIAGRKHRGIRDPEKQQATRLAAISQKINCPPKDNDEQAIPKSLLRIQELQRQMLNSPKNSIKQRKNNHKKEQKIGMFKRLKGETDKSFLNRVHKQTEEVLKEAHFSDKYNVDIIRNKESGEVERVQKRPKDDLAEYLKRVKNEKGKKKKTKKQLQREAEPKLTKSQKKRQKLLAKKEKRLQNHPPQTNETQKIEVAFGEVCHAPPTLTLPRLHNKVQEEAGAKPGKRNLLLKTVLNAENNNGVYQNSKPMDKKTTRLRDLPGLIRKKIESNQKAAIEAYKQLKASKYKQ